MVELTAEDKLIKARIELLREKPFFAYLANHLKFIEDSKNFPTMGVDIEGNLYYNPKFVEKLNKDECKGVVCHEVMHCALEHMKRLRGKNQPLWNSADDVVVNQILTCDGIQLPKDGLIPHNGEITIYNVKITDIGNKCAEEVYDELYGKIKNKQLKDMQNYINGHGDSKKGFDIHIYPKDGEGDGKGDKTGKGSGGKDGKGKVPSAGELSQDKGKNWGKLMVEACTFARNQGNLPAGMERILGKLLENELDWRTLLYKYITNTIPIDYTWAKPSKKSYSLGTYLPSVTKESLDLVVAIDTSGSISQQDLSDFASELVGIVSRFQNVNMTVIDCDCQVNSVNCYQNIKVSDIDDLKMHGGGGTSHLPVYEYVEKNLPATKLLINFTDGYTTYPKSSSIPTLWVITGNYNKNGEAIPFGDVVYIKSNGNDEY